MRGCAYACDIAESIHRDMEDSISEDYIASQLCRTFRGRSVDLVAWVYCLQDIGGYVGIESKHWNLMKVASDRNLDVEAECNRMEVWQVLHLKGMRRSLKC